MHTLLLTYPTGSIVEDEQWMQDYLELQRYSLDVPVGMRFQAVQFDQQGVPWLHLVTFDHGLTFVEMGCIGGKWKELAGNNCIVQFREIKSFSEYSKYLSKICGKVACIPENHS